MTLIDILKFVASAGVFSAVALCFIRFFGKPKFDFSRAVAWPILCRIVGIHAAVAFVCCVIGQMSADDLALPLGIYLLAVLVSLLFVRVLGGGINIGDAVAAGVVAAILFPAFALGYFVLEPARKHSSDFEPDSPPRGPGHSNEFEQFDADAIGLVVSPLKPFGAIELGGQKVPACSVDGGFIPAGERVQVDRREGRTLFVKRVNVQV